MQGDIRTEGWEAIPLTADVRARVEALFRDIVRYSLIMVEDSGIALDHDVGALKEALRDADLDTAEAELQKVLLEIAARDRPLLGRLYDIGTRPMRLMSGRELFFADAVRDVTDRFFARDDTAPLLVCPYNGETLHVFPPGQENYRYNLPVHQDYPYLLQSHRQLTFWLSLTRNPRAAAGGVRFHPRSHEHGIARTRVAEHGHYEVATETYPGFDPDDCVDTRGDLFEFYAIDSLIWHTSLRNLSADQLRLTYIFRISDIAEGRVPFGADRARAQDGTFEQHHPGLSLASGD